MGVLRVFMLIKILFIFIIPLSISAELLQIIHTNDLHGYLDHTVYDESKGGYHRVKTVIDDLKKGASVNGIDSLVLDAGDFMEGSIYYMANRGRRTLSIMNDMGYDAVVLGNHDWLMGTKELDALLEDVSPQFSLLAANFKVKTPLIHPHIKKHINERLVIEKSGVKIAIVGLTTDELFYRWAFDKGRIKDPIKAGKKISKKIKKKEKDIDFTFALTHLGLSGDRKLVENSQFDLVIGGHSHSALHEEVYVKNKDGISVPIVQAGEHGNYVGQLIVDVEKGKPVRVVSYKLIPVTDSYERDSNVELQVIKAREEINKMYGKEWLETIVGKSEIPLQHSQYKLTLWTAFITDALKESVNADISFHSPNFAGTDLKVGNITREDLYNTHPRVFNLDDKYGWAVYNVNIYGWALKLVTKIVLKMNLPVSFSGITFDLIRDDKDKEDFKVKNIKVKGRKVKALKKYRVALNEGIVVGGLGITRFVKLILRQISKTEKTVWGALIDKVKKEKVITKQFFTNESSQDSEFETYHGRKKKYHKYNDRMFVPALN